MVWRKGRVLFENDPQVLVGEWFEETKIHESGNPVICGGTGETLYQTDYMAPRPEPDAVQGSRNIVYDSAIRSLGQPASLADVGYSTNFATLYDLTFNRAAPELNRFCGEELRKYKASARAYFPIRDYTNNFVGGEFGSEAKIW
ncbi:Hypothetical protein NTJ_13394 [Nesidiocoris tenuis]|uniref:Uncharacterized protein n=1 Tax=Nesidiocoris tenuis TaxID=355587 RepID=A0ABN7BAB1_9HEMI|nr:Hypothetical protein NTJ_13394 [Nesidiocoris tenuis]